MDLSHDYQTLRQNWHTNLVKLHHYTTQIYKDEEKFLQPSLVTSWELDRKFDTWVRLQDIINNGMTELIFNARESWPAWLKQIWDILLFVDPHRTCFEVLDKIIPILEKTP